MAGPLTVALCSMLVLSATHDMTIVNGRLRADGLDQPPPMIP